jgi:hypothetical protein
MAHFARLNEDNKVIQIIVISDEDCLDENGNESEEVGKTFCNKLIKGNWIQTSYNANFRKRFAGMGMIYDEEHDVFIGDKPYESWSINNNGDWEPPVSYPQDGKDYDWNEQNLQWIERIK